MVRDGDGMSKGLRKSTIREIQGSFGRYMAILLIVALGVGFFSGLKVAHEAMVHTANDYFTDLNLFDYHLLSTLGFEEDSVKALAKKDGVSAAEGGKSLDLLMDTEDGSEHVIKFISIPQQINLPQLTEGRMPEQANECLVDEHVFKTEQIGQTIRISDANDKDDRKLLTEKEYTIVGLCRSPLYTMYDRGTTSVGDGKLDAFIYIMPEAFDMDYDTDIYVTFEKGKDAAIYTDAYDQVMDDKENLWKEYAQEQADARYNSIYADAEKKIDDADDTLAKESADGAKELEDALQEITDGAKQLSDGQQAITKAKKEIADQEKLLEEKEKEYKKGYAAYRKSVKEYNAGKKAYDKGLAEYNTQYAEYEKNVKAYQDGADAYEAARKEYESSKEKLDAVKDYLEESERNQQEQKLTAAKLQLDTTAATLQATKQQLDAAGTAFATNKTTLDATQKQLEAAKKQLDKAEKQFTSAKKQLAEGKDKIAQAKQTIASKESQLTDAKKDLETGQAEYEDGKQEYDRKISDAKKKIADSREELADMDKPEVYVLGRESNTGYANFENDSAIVNGVAKVFPIFFFLVAALVCMTTMTRMVEEQRTQIGILKALGYSNASIIGKYMIYSGSAALIGAITGFFAGTEAFSNVIWIAYKMLYDMGDLHYVWNGTLAFISVLVALLCSAGTTFVACRQELEEMAAMLMRPKSPKVGKRVLLEKIPAVWNHLKFLDKVSVRNLFRYKKRFFMMIIGVSGCTALLVAGQGVRDSIATIADTQFQTISLYDMVVGGDDIRKADGMESLLINAQSSADVTYNGTVKSVSILVPEQTDSFDSYMDLHTQEGEKVALPGEGEVVISYKLADSLGLQIGDTFLLQNADLSGGEVTVSGIYQNYFNHYVILCQTTYRSLFGEEPDWNAAFVNVSDNADADTVAAELMKESGVSSVNVSKDLRDKVSDMMVSMDYVVMLVIACGAMLAFIVIYNLNNINITERIREIATIKVLGFYKEETNSYVFRENIILTLIGSLVGLVIGHYLHAFIMSQIQIDAIAFDVHVSKVSYVISVLLTLLFNQIVNIFMSRKLEAIDMAESLKSVE